MKLLVEFEWDDKAVGEDWFDMFNLELYLFTQQYTQESLLKVKEIIKKEGEDGKSNQ